MKQNLRKQLAPAPAEDYAAIRSINGWHPLKEQAPGTYVEYAARKRKNAKILFFNFALAKEMGILPKEHENTLNRQLTKALLETFAIQIINEYDIVNEIQFPKKDIKENRYMATRYLQLQHPNKQGLTSGDGRSLWNGTFQGNGSQWDVSSCGTGATCLSPATAQSGKFFRTGDPSVAYGCGYSDVHDGLSNAIFSEILAKNGVKTERSLLVLEFPRGRSINVRVGKNLLRPSHFFNHLKQNHYARLRSVVDFFIERQIKNRVFDRQECKKNPYPYLLNYIAETFAQMTAQFETEYIFCWLDWDGDNILADGGIIDYGSIRQFGLFHREYRYDDVERWSTTIIEQKIKARNIVQTFAQMVDYLSTEKKKPLAHFRRAPILQKFDRVYEMTMKKLLLKRLGLSEKQATRTLLSQRKLVNTLQKHFRYFEHAASSRGLKKTGDGINRDAVFCMRDILRELPSMLVANFAPIPAKDFTEIIASSYATRRDLRLTRTRRYKIKAFQAAYMQLLDAAAKANGMSTARLLKEVCERSEVINRFERVTGDAIIHVGASLARHRKNLSTEDMHELIDEFVDEQILVPNLRKKTSPANPRRLFKNLLELVKTYREGI